MHGTNTASRCYWSNEINDADRNLSFEREFGKVIGRLDLFAEILAERSNRTLFPCGFRRWRQRCSCRSDLNGGMCKPQQIQNELTAIRRIQWPWLAEITTASM